MLARERAGSRAYRALAQTGPAKRKRPGMTVGYGRAGSSELAGAACCTWPPERAARVTGGAGSCGLGALYVLYSPAPIARLHRLRPRRRRSPQRQRLRGPGEPAPAGLCGSGGQTHSIGAVAGWTTMNSPAPYDTTREFLRDALSDPMAATPSPVSTGLVSGGCKTCGVSPDLGTFFRGLQEVTFWNLQALF